MRAVVDEPEERLDPQSQISGSARSGTSTYRLCTLVVARTVQVGSILRGGTDTNAGGVS